jgi:pre-rRNA-processing protein TSR3
VLFLRGNGFFRFLGSSFLLHACKCIEGHGLAALDCSWEHAEKVLSGHVRGTSRCLPLLVAGKPVNFGKPTKLTTVEALAAALIIAGFEEEARELWSVFTWDILFLI